MTSWNLVIIGWGNSLLLVHCQVIKSTKFQLNLEWTVPVKSPNLNTKFQHTQVMNYNHKYHRPIEPQQSNDESKISGHDSFITWFVSCMKFWTTLQWIYQWKYKYIHERTCIWNCCLQNVSHFLQASMCSGVILSICIYLHCGDKLMLWPCHLHNRIILVLLEIFAWQINLIFHFDGLVQNCSNSSANALELLQLCAKLLISSTFILYTTREILHIN